VEDEMDDGATSDRATNGGPRGVLIRSERYGTTVRLVVAGELDLATAPTLRESYAHEHSDGAGLILVDLTAVTFMDSTGLRALLDACAEDDRLRIILSAQAARIVDITGVRSILPIVEG
jgi:anti-sigma B factor antagonist